MEIKEKRYGKPIPSLQDFSWRMGRQKMSVKIKSLSFEIEPYILAKARHKYLDNFTLFDKEKSLPEYLYFAGNEATARKVKWQYRKEGLT